MNAPSPRRPALRWYGGKWQLAPWIVQHLPTHSAYVEPYGGAASVLLRKPVAPVETFNDRHGRLINFFRVLRDQPDDLLQRIELTPYARGEYEQAGERAGDLLEDARRFYVLAQQSRAGGGQRAGYAGWRAERDPGRESAADGFSHTDHLRVIAARLKHVQIENDEAAAVLDRYDGLGVLFYVDPTYVPSERNRERYEHELTEADHGTLADQLHQVRGMVVLSGYPSALYDELYGGWSYVDCRHYADSARPVTERLWLNPAAEAAVPQGSLW